MTTPVATVPYTARHQNATYAAQRALDELPAPLTGDAIDGWAAAALAGVHPETLAACHREIDDRRPKGKDRHGRRVSRTPSQLRALLDALWSTLDASNVRLTKRQIQCDDAIKALHRDADTLPRRPGCGESRLLIPLAGTKGGKVRILCGSWECESCRYRLTIDWRAHLGIKIGRAAVAGLALVTWTGPQDDATACRHRITRATKRASGGDMPPHAGLVTIKQPGGHAVIVAAVQAKAAPTIKGVAIATREDATATIERAIGLIPLTTRRPITPTAPWRQSRKRNPPRYRPLKAPWSVCQEVLDQVGGEVGMAGPSYSRTADRRALVILPSGQRSAVHWRRLAQWVDAVRDELRDAAEASLEYGPYDPDADMAARERAARAREPLGDKAGFRVVVGESAQPPAPAASPPFFNGGGG